MPPVSVPSLTSGSHATQCGLILRSSFTPAAMCGIKEGARNNGSDASITVRAHWNGTGRSDGTAGIPAQPDIMRLAPEDGLTYQDVALMLFDLLYRDNSRGAEATQLLAAPVLAAWAQVQKRRAAHG